MGVVHSHTADHIGSLTCSRAGGRKLCIILIFRVAVNGDDADGRAWCVRDNNGLRLVTGKGSAVDHIGG